MSKAIAWLSTRRAVAPSFAGGFDSPPTRNSCLARLIMLGTRRGVLSHVPFLLWPEEMVLGRLIPRRREAERLDS